MNAKKMKMTYHYAAEKDGAEAFISVKTPPAAVKTTKRSMNKSF